MLLDDSFVDGLKGVAVAFLAQDGSFLFNMALTSGSTSMLAPHRSILSPGEPIHFRVFSYSSLFECIASSPSSPSCHPESKGEYRGVRRGLGGRARNRERGAVSEVDSEQRRAVNDLQQVGFAGVEDEFGLETWRVK